mgnify:CR=1 FL=1
MRAILWMIPILSVVTNLISYAIALGMSVDTGMVVNILLGIMFVIMGNYMHKIKQNYSVGIKLPWTLNSEETEPYAQSGSWLFHYGRSYFCDQWISAVKVGAFCIPCLCVPDSCRLFLYLYKKEYKITGNLISCRAPETAGILDNI